MSEHEFRNLPVGATVYRGGSRENAEYIESKYRNGCYVQNYEVGPAQWVPFTDARSYTRYPRDI